jgi:hypothetical protein
MQLAWNCSVRYCLDKIPQLYPHLRHMNPSYILKPHRPGLKRILTVFSRLHLDRVSVLYPLAFPTRTTYKVPITLIYSTVPKIQLNSMGQNPSWKTNKFSASQEILRVVLNPKVYYQFLKIHFNTTFHLHLGLPCAFFPASFPTKALQAPLLSLIRATCPSTSLDEIYGS